MSVIEKAPVLLAGEEGSFALYTLRNRLPGILRTAVEDVEREYGWDNLNEATVKAEAAQLEKELSEPFSMEVKLIEADQDDLASKEEYKRWTSHFGERLPCTLTDLSFLEAETYFYYRLLHLFRFHSTYIDHFRIQKRDSMEGCKEAARSVVDYTIRALEAAPSVTSDAEGELSDEERTQIRFLLNCSLWGNRVDLSLFKNASDRSHAVESIEALNVNMLADDSVPLIVVLEQTRGNKNSQLDIILDNFGYELVTDLALVTYLLERNVVEKVILHTKAFPTFVSDSTTSDVNWMLEIFGNESYAGSTGVKFASKLQSYMEAGRLIARAHAGFNDPKDYSEFHDEFLTKELGLSSSTMCLLKGDLNYRRLVGDRHWNCIETDFSEIVGNVFPCPTASLRTLKSQVSVGLGNAKERVAELEKSEKDTWRVCGKYGVIQLALP